MCQLTQSFINFGIVSTAVARHPALLLWAWGLTNAKTQLGWNNWFALLSAKYEFYLALNTHKSPEAWGKKKYSNMFLNLWELKSLQKFGVSLMSAWVFLWRYHLQNLTETDYYLERIRSPFLSVMSAHDISCSDCSLALLFYEITNQVNISGGKMCGYQRLSLIKKKKNYKYLSKSGVTTVVDQINPFQYMNCLENFCDTYKTD